MKRLLAEYLKAILSEIDMNTPIQYVDARGNTRTASLITIQRKGSTHPGWEKYQAYMAGAGRDGEPETELEIYGKPSQETNAESVLQSIVQDGYIGKPPPGNDFSHYQEPMSVLVARWILDNPEASDQEIMEHLTSIDCDSELLAKKVSSQLPKQYSKEFKDMDSAGVFSNSCSKKYSSSKNAARFVTMLMAKSKAKRMQTAISENQLKDVQFDVFSGDKASLASMKSIIENLPDNVSIGTETGKKISKGELLKRIDGFGTSKFPADTAMIGQSPSGDIVFMGFSDKQDLKATINNSTVTSGVRKKQELLGRLVERGIITSDERDKISGEIDSYVDEYDEIESELKIVTTSPARELIGIIESNPTKTKELIDKIKNLSTGKNPAKYWNGRIKNVFEGAVAGKYPHGPKVKYLEAVGWKPGDKLTDEIMLAAWANMSLESLESDTEDLPKDDQDILFRSEVIDNRQLVEQVGDIRDRSLAILGEMRDSLNQVEITDNDGTTFPLGTYVDAVDAWEALHFDMRDYKGALTMAAGDQIVDYTDIEHCLGGVSDRRTFADTLSIETRRIRDRTYGEYTTGQNIEVFAIAPSGDKINVGVREIRSKGGILGRLETTFKYHRDYQECLKSRKDKG